MILCFLSASEVLLNRGILIEQGSAGRDRQNLQHCSLVP